MPRRVSVTTLNARTIDILNTIRANASAEYQSLVPVVTVEKDIPKVGEVLFGYPAMANQFLNALMNRIAMVQIKSATFNNMYADLKKGYLEYGETIEEAFVNICKAREFSAEKAPAREFKRSLPDVRAAFHIMNWRVQYPITISQDELRTAFLSADGVTNMVTRIIDSVYTAAEYDEFLLFKYLIIKAVSHGKMYPVAFDATNMTNAAKTFRGTSNGLTFMKNTYNEAGVHTTTPKDNQYIFMDAQFNADYDVDVLAAAFNMDKADFSGKLKLIDDFTTFDNDRFSEVVSGSDQIEEVTAAELTLMKDVKAVLVDGEWFQVYDNLNVMTETPVASGLYYNYFYNTWKTVSSSPFSNAVVFVDDGASLTPPVSITVEVTAKNIAEESTVVILTPQFDSAQIGTTAWEFVQTEEATEAGIGVQKYGAILIPALAGEATYTIKLGSNTYSIAEEDLTEEDVGDTLTFAKDV